MFPTNRRREETPRRPKRRHARLRAFVVVLTLVSTLLGAATIAVAESSPSRPMSPIDLAFQAVALPAGPATPASSPIPMPEPAGRPADAPALGPVADFAAPEALDADAAREAYGQPDVASTANARVQSKLPPGKIRARGNATWYCLSGVSSCHRDYGGGLYAAAGPALRVGDWRGRTVTVCTGSRCVTVQLVDWCACPGGRVIDLYSAAFRRLAPLSEGEIRVAVRW